MQGDLDKVFIIGRLVSISFVLDDLEYILFRDCMCSSGERRLSAIIHFNSVNVFSFGLIVLFELLIFNIVVGMS